MILYKIYKNKNTKSSTVGMYYARTVSTETIDVEGLASHMASHNSPFSKGVIAGVLKDAVACVKELVLDGKNVKLDDLAIFSCGITTKPAESAAAFTPTENIAEVRLRARATGILRSAALTSEARVKQLSTYSVDDTAASDK